MSYILSALLVMPLGTLLSPCAWQSTAVPAHVHCGGQSCARAPWTSSASSSATQARAMRSCSAARDSARGSGLGLALLLVQNSQTPPQHETPHASQLTRAQLPYTLLRALGAPDSR